VRFGEAFENPYAEGEAHSWFHLACAALMAPAKLLAVLAEATDELPERDWLTRTAEVGAAHRRLPRLAGAERASSGRAHCRHCHELIGKATFRLRLQTFEDGRAVPLGYIHVACAGAYFGFADILDRIERLTPAATDADRTELALALGTEPAPLAPLAKAKDELAEGALKSG
jgi:hypothetical protein